MASNILTIEGVVQNGQIRLPLEIKLPEGARVFIVVPDVHVHEQARVYSPRLKYHEQARDFEMQVDAEKNVVLDGPRQEWYELRPG